MGLGLRYSPELTRIESGRARIHIRASGSAVSSLRRHLINIFDKLSAYSWLSVVLGDAGASKREGNSLFSCSLQSGARDIKQMPAKLLTTFTKQHICKSGIINLAHKDSEGKKESQSISH